MSYKIAIIDDEIHIRSLLEQTLEELEEEHNVEIFSASDGREGLALIQAERPQVVFLDIMMPKMNGYEVCRTVKGNSEFDETHIILLTAKGQEIDKKQGMDCGAFKYMTKPFDPDEVLSVAKGLLRLNELPFRNQNPGFKR
jgi:two-component system alkaline phosphatase synthesis response regulator PhoP